FLSLLSLHDALPIFFLLGLLLFSVIPFLGEFRLTGDDLKGALKEEHYGKLVGELSPILEKTYPSNIAFIKDFNHYFDGYNDKFKDRKSTRLNSSHVK